MELIRLENITKTYHLGEVDVPVLRGVSLSIAKGEMVALMGASGSGKTTLMNILGCLDRPSGGKYWLDGQEMSQLTPNQRALVRTEKLGFVFQSFNLLPRTTAVQNVLMPLDYSPSRIVPEQSHHLARLLLERVGLAERCHHEPSQMSGGQQQRVAIARSLINRPALLLADEPTGNLDSRTSVEILRMFQRLNAEGITVILVTHDAKVAAYAHRTIVIEDGMVAGDETSQLYTHQASLTHGRLHFSQAAGENGGSVSTSQTSTTTALTESGHHHLHIGSNSLTQPENWLNLQDASPKRLLPAIRIPATFRTAFGALRRNAMRSALTALGVIIGVAAVIAMTEIGQGSKMALQRTIAGMGANNLMILPGSAVTGSVNIGSGSMQTLKPGDMDEIIRQCPAISDVAPMVGSKAQVVYGNRNWIPRQIIGTTPSFLAVRDWEDMQEGNIFTDRDVRNGNKVCVLGRTIAGELFQDESPVGKEVRLNNVPFRVVGVLSRKGANMMGHDQDDVVMAPWPTIKFRINGAGAGAANTAQAAPTASSSGINSLSNLYPGKPSLYPVPSPIQLANTPQPVRMISVDSMVAKAVSEEQIPEAIEQIRSLLRERHHLQANEQDDFDIRDLTEIRKTRSESSEVMSALLVVVAAISLFVGGVGIMNIMLVSVTERTREIGLRMAVGARGHHILRQFLVEAVLLCLSGGAVGIAVGRVASLLIRSIKRWPTEPSLSLIIVSVLVSAGVGIIFGFYSAWKASRLDPIEALRYE